MFRVAPRVCELCLRTTAVPIGPSITSSVLGSSTLYSNTPALHRSLHSTQRCNLVVVLGCSTLYSNTLAFYRNLHTTQRCNLVVSQVCGSKKKDSHSDLSSDPSHANLSDPSHSDLSKDPLIKEWMREMHEDFEKEGKKVKNKLSEGGEGERAQDTRASQAIAEDSNAVLDPPLQTAPKTPLQVWTQFATKKYEAFDPHSSQIIYDYNEERLRRQEEVEEEEEQEEEMREKVKLERGKRGVFDVEELVEVLREENGKDIVVIQVPAELAYVEYMVIVSSRSRRHSDALAELVRRVYNAKKSRKDPPLILEGRGSNWVALDMRNIALHIMDPKTREIYDLETLWTVGAEYDDKNQQPDEEDMLSVYKNLDPMAGLGAPDISSSQK